MCYVRLCYVSYVTHLYAIVLMMFYGVLIALHPCCFSVCMFLCRYVGYCMLICDGVMLRHIALLVRVMYWYVVVVVMMCCDILC